MKRRVELVIVTCDLCGVDSDGTQWPKFVELDGFDFCNHCAGLRTIVPGISEMECGRHLVRFHEDGWRCSCGRGFYESTPLIEGRDARMLAALPHVGAAYARMHIEGLWG